MSYDDRFGRDWDPAELHPDEALERAFALGVDARMGRDPQEELERLRSVAGNKYDDTMLDLAFEEGRREAARVQEDRDGGGETEVWDALMDGELVEPEPPARSTGSGGRDELPECLQRLSLDTEPDDSREALELPQYLRQR